MQLQFDEYKDNKQIIAGDKGKQDFINMLYDYIHTFLDKYKEPQHIKEVMQLFCIVNSLL